MQYTVACNWDPELIDKVDYPEVKSLFGAVPDSVISGGRPSKSIKNLGEAEIKAYIQRVHDKGWDFDFNMNSTCLANKESTLEGFKEIIQYLERIVSLGVDSVTISNTNLINIVRKNFPNLKIKVSTFQKVSNVHQAQRLEDMGVTSIMLSEHVNRDFKLLREIRRHVSCKLILIANVGCIFNCPNIFSHANSVAHSGTVGGVKTVFAESHHSYCTQKRLEDPVELIKIRWIRPDDVAYYEDAGIDMLKILERFSKTDVLAARMKAFHERKYDGNILELLGQMPQKHSNEVLMNQIRNLDKDSVEKAIKYFGMYSPMLSDLYYLDNARLPQDFIHGFTVRDCDKLACSVCGYCGNIANKAVRNLDQEKTNAMIAKIKEVRNEIMDGTLLY